MMKKSSNTNATLNSNIALMQAPKRGLSWTTALVVCITVLVFSILVKLGFWQLSRADEKAAWQQQLTARQASAPLSYPQLLAMTTDTALTGYRLQVDVSPTASPIIMLDNQVYNGTVGYLVLQVMQVAPHETALLVELGFVPGGIDRRALPQVQPITSSVSLSGRLYQKSLNPMSEQLFAESGDPMRIQNLNITALQQQLQRRLAPVVLQPTSRLPTELAHPWQPIPLSAHKHHGYALQWFAMAAAFALLMGYVWIRKIKTIS
ncbi:SURF1-like protein [Shewanella algidipiscicola]|uniref:SURF1-like protein n=2 Tax=Shewanella algidipiscicola TaxID=614070 RepID=A0ABQ4PDA2_9GAMM|nr:SURF1-like protein [Shewanella algidipiscicola]